MIQTYVLYIWKNYLILYISLKRINLEKNTFYISLNKLSPNIFSANSAGICISIENFTQINFQHYFSFFQQLGKGGGEG